MEAFYWARIVIDAIINSHKIGIINSIFTDEKQTYKVTCPGSHTDRRQ